MGEHQEMNRAEERITLFAEMVLPVPIDKTFTYRIPELFNEKVKVGQRGIVPFGDRKILTGVILQLHTTPPTGYEVRMLLDLLDEEPSLTSQQLALLTWMADYYLCTPGEVLHAALPAGLKLSSESRVQLHPAFDADASLFDFSAKEELVLTRLKETSLSYTEIAQLLQVKHIYALIKSLVNKEAVVLYEEVKDNFKPKTERRIRLTPDYLTHNALEKLFETLVKQPRQEELLLKYLQEVPVLQHPEKNQEGLPKSGLMEGMSASALATLSKKGVLEEFEVIVSRFAEESPGNTEIRLSEEQEQCVRQLLANFEDHATALLHGVTGSGKTEIYIHLIQKAIESSSQVLYLLPEIALTTQIVQRLRKVFGSALGVYHSRYTDNERVEVWQGITSGKFKLIIGARSAVFLPFTHLGLIIVDEEHDASYKQQEPAPRYHARDVALMLGHLHHAKVLLGSATPSVETYYLAQRGKYGAVSLNSRFGEAQLPLIDLVDIPRERKAKRMKGEFSQILLNEISAALTRGEQAIIFQNRRGYSPIVTCEDCAWIPRCMNCSVSLTYHQYRHALVCHYCGYKESLPAQCPVCTSSRILTSGYGTEKLEEELRLHFPEAGIQRMDLDTTRSKTGYEEIMNQFEQGATDILVGTQMVTKGLDFTRVSLVGVFNADRMLHFPDFRSFERGFQLLTQVSGRAGRRDKPGKVIIQTSQPGHPVLQWVLQHAFLRFYDAELNERREYHYPPFSRLIELTLKHTDARLVREASAQLAQTLRQQLSGLQIMGPGEPMVSKIRNQYLMSILIKIPRDTGQLPEVKKQLTEICKALLRQKDFRSVRILPDVDPA